MSRKLIAVIVALSAGCAAQKPQQKSAKNEAQYSSAGQPKPKGVMRCHMERETGSNFAERVCVYDEGKPEDADASDGTIDETLRRAQQRAAQHVEPQHP